MNDDKKWLADPDRVKNATALADVLTSTGPASHRLLKKTFSGRSIEPVEAYSQRSDFSKGLDMESFSALSDYAEIRCSGVA